jgi:hypothetical protein
MLKSDLIKIQDMIKYNSSDIKMYKLLSKTPGLTKKLSEIEENKNLNIEKISESSKNIDKISKIYGTKNLQELVSKLFMELTFNEQILKKINDYFILMKLKLYKDDTYQENLSKILSIQTFMEKASNIVPISGGLDERIIQLSLEKEKLAKELFELKEKIEKKENINDKNNIENKSLLEVRDKEINNLKKENEALKKKLEEEKENNNNNSVITTTNNSNVFETEIKFRNSSDFKKILANFETELKKSRSEFCSKINEEIKEIKNKFDKLEENYKVINDERKSLKKEVDKMRKGGFDQDSYEAVLREQFETMKKSFMEKLENLNEELNNVKQESRVKIYQVEEEMKECNYLKNVFLNQLVTLQAKLENNN